MTDHPVNCKTALNHMKKQYKRFTQLTINDDAIKDLFMEDVLTHEQKLEIQMLNVRKRMENLLDYIIIPSLQAGMAQKYINLVNIMMNSDDSLLRAMASEMIKLHK